MDLLIEPFDFGGTIFQGDINNGCYSGCNANCTMCNENCEWGCHAETGSGK